MDGDDRESFAELFRRLIEYELPPAETFRKVLEEVLRRLGMARNAELPSADSPE